jgi:hypothetical protein
LEDKADSLFVKFYSADIQLSVIRFLLNDSSITPC